MLPSLTIFSAIDVKIDVERVSRTTAPNSAPDINFSKRPKFAMKLGPEEIPAVKSAIALSASVLNTPWLVNSVWYPKIPSFSEPFKITSFA